MAVTALRAAILLFSAALVSTADQSRDVLDVINHVASGLTNGDPSDAMSPFSKSFAKYDTLQNYFVALTNAFQITNEAGVVDEQDSPAETRLTLEWSLNLTGRVSNENTRRTGEVQVRLVLEKHQWRIVDFSPISLFDPQASPAGK
jgi:hypothetical protein